MSHNSHEIETNALAMPFISEPQTIINGPDGYVAYYPTFLTADYAHRLFEYLKSNIEWEQRSMRAYGRMVKFPRLIAWFNKKRDSYAFSGISVDSKDIPPPIQRFFEAFEQRFGLIFNSVLLNYYRDGNDSISWHTDAEPELGENPTVASISLGATRRFMLRHEKTKRTLSLDLEHGSLLVMREAMMHFWRHQIPKQPKITEPRINLTFRYMLPQAANGTNLSEK